MIRASPMLVFRRCVATSYPKSPIATKFVAAKAGKAYSSYVKKATPKVAETPEFIPEDDLSTETPAKASPVGAAAASTAAGGPLGDAPTIDWAQSFHGLGTTPFARDIADILLAPIANEDIEIKPDGLIYLPEIKYRRILNRAFGPGGWGLAPRTESLISAKQITREYGLICHGRLVSVARGEQQYFGDDKVTTALEGCKSNALMRCCKDLGIASELWDQALSENGRPNIPTRSLLNTSLPRRRRSYGN